MCLGNSIKTIDWNELAENNQYDLKHMLQDDSSTIFDTCDYSQTSCLNYENTFNFNCLHLNRHSLLCKQSALIDLIDRLHSQHIKLDLLALCETLSNRRQDQVDKFAWLLTRILQQSRTV